MLIWTGANTSRSSAVQMTFMQQTVLLVCLPPLCLKSHSYASWFFNQHLDYTENKLYSIGFKCIINLNLISCRSCLFLPKQAETFSTEWTDKITTDQPTKQSNAESSHVNWRQSIGEILQIHLAAAGIFLQNRESSVEPAGGTFIDPLCFPWTASKIPVHCCFQWFTGK